MWAGGAGVGGVEGRRVATGEAAGALGLDRDIGAIAPGLRADLVLIAGDPLADIRALRHPKMVWRDGHLVARDGLIVLPGTLER